MFSSVVSEAEFNVVIPKISAFSLIQGCVGDVVVSLYLEFMLMRGSTFFFSALMVVVGNADNVVCLI